MCCHYLRSGLNNEVLVSAPANRENHLLFIIACCLPYKVLPLFHQKSHHLLPWQNPMKPLLILQAPVRVISLKKYKGVTSDQVIYDLRSVILSQKRIHSRHCNIFG